MDHIRLAYKNDIKEFFDNELEKRIRIEYSEKREKEILRNVLTDSKSAIAYAKRLYEIQCTIKAEIESVLGFEVDVGFDPNAQITGISDRVDSLETLTSETSAAMDALLTGEEAV